MQPPSAPKPPEKKPLKGDDVSLLLPSFRVAVSLLMARMKALRFDPVAFDTYRTAEQAAAKATAGKGVEGSMHEYGAACDFVCQTHRWDCGKGNLCLFYVVLGREAKSLGLIWGGDWKKRDLVHVQGIPVAWQGRMRALGVGPETAKERNQLVVDWLLRNKTVPGPAQ